MTQKLSILIKPLSPSRIILLLILLSSLFCGSSGRKSSIVTVDPGATGNIDIKYRSSYFTNDLERPLGNHIYFFQSGAKMPLSRNQSLFFKAYNGTVNSGVKSAYTWTFKNLPSWLTVDTTTSSQYVILKIADAKAKLTSGCTIWVGNVTPPTPPFCEPMVATGQIKSVFIKNAGIGFVAGLLQSNTHKKNNGGGGLGFNVQLQLFTPTPAPIKKVNIMDRGFGFSSSPDNIALNQTGKGQILEPQVMFPITITVEVKSDENKISSATTDIIVLYNDQNPHKQLYYPYPDMKTAYRTSGGTNESSSILSFRENSLDYDSTCMPVEYRPNDGVSITRKCFDDPNLTYNSGTPASDPKVRVASSDINGSCDVRDTKKEYQAIVPGQTIQANAGKNGKDCYAFYVPYDGYKVNFTIKSNTLAQDISDCYRSEARNASNIFFDIKYRDKCARVLEFASFNTNKIPINTGKIVSSVAVGVAGSNYFFPAATSADNLLINFAGGNTPSTGDLTPTAAANIKGVVSSITIVNQGTNYSTSPVALTVDLKGGGGTGATATPVVVGGKITAINITSGGSGYIAPPTVIINDGGILGYGFSGYATIKGGITSISLSQYGSGYTSAPTVSATQTGASGANLTANLDFVDVVNYTRQTGLYSCAFEGLTSVAPKCDTANAIASFSPVLSMYGNSGSNPNWGLNPTIRQWSWSFVFSKTNAMASHSTKFIRNAKCIPTSSTSSTYIDDTLCQDDPNKTGQQAWYTGPGWYYLVIDSAQQEPVSGNYQSNAAGCNNADSTDTDCYQTGGDNQPYQITMGLDNN